MQKRKQKTVTQEYSINAKAAMWFSELVSTDSKSRFLRCVEELAKLGFIFSETPRDREFEL